MRWAATLRAQKWTGYRFGDPAVRLWHQTLGMSKARPAKEEHADALLSNRTPIPIFELSDENLSKMIDVVVRAQPAVLNGQLYQRRSTSSRST